MAFLALLGFSSACENGGDEYGTAAVEYGVPTATFIVKGNVKSEQGSANIPSVRVVMGYDTTYTNASGNYQVQQSDFPSDNSFLVEFSDVDGAENGSFEDLDEVVDFTDPQFNGGEGFWNQGSVKQELNVNLKKKE